MGRLLEFPTKGIRSRIFHLYSIFIYGKGSIFWVLGIFFIMADLCDAFVHIVCEPSFLSTPSVIFFDHVWLILGQ